MPTYEPRDRFYRKARERGLPSRAAFKIEELIRRAHVLKAGARVVDLGCAPGGWLAILVPLVGTNGKVVGVDLATVRNLPLGAAAIVGDITDEKVAARAAETLGGAADLVTSDLAPKLTGIAPRDEARHAQLVDAALGLAIRVLRPGGAMIAKLFMGAEFKRTLAKFEREFESVEVTRVSATRPGSSELYVIARGFRRGRQ
ncbi:MAG TPA: RlmE family RNA methyltransferase [Candidatus Binataceae bacterium]|nr:RlmE family RNA methyltransferase [Candidatus Binataceae bacterium]